MSEVAHESRKSYEQVCPTATALDFIGDRWTLLILRELLGSPARFQELKNGLPGIAPNLLTERLRRLEADGIVRRTTVDTASIYALTEEGSKVRTVIVELGVWASGMGRVGPPTNQRSIRALAVALEAALSRGTPSVLEPLTIIEVEVDGQPLEVTLHGHPSVRARPASEPEARLATTRSQISALLAGETPDSPIFEHVAGETDAATRLMDALSHRELNVA
jgi:DNA-binding HxlR family transcriptional regulator